MQNQVTAMAPPTSRLNQNDGFVQMDRLAIKTNAIPWSQASLQNNWRFIVHPAVKQITFDTLACSLSALLSLHWTRSLQIVDPNLDFQIQPVLGPDQPLQKQRKNQSWTAPPNWQSRIRFHPADLDLWKAGDVQPCGPWALHLLHLVEEKTICDFFNCTKLTVISVLNENQSMVTIVINKLSEDFFKAKITITDGGKNDFDLCF